MHDRAVLLDVGGGRRDLQQLGEIVVAAFLVVHAALFHFIEETYGNENEILVAVSSLTGNKECVDFINQFGCEAYFTHNKELLYFERQQDLEQRIKNIGL